MNKNQKFGFNGALRFFNVINEDDHYQRLNHRNSEFSMQFFSCLLDMFVTARTSIRYNSVGRDVTKTTPVRFSC